MQDENMNNQNMPPMTANHEAFINERLATAVDAMNESNGPGYIAEFTVDTECIISRFISYANVVSPLVMQATGADDEWIGGTEHMLNMYAVIASYKDDYDDHVCRTLFAQAMFPLDNFDDNVAQSMVPAYVMFMNDCMDGAIDFCKWVRDELNPAVFFTATHDLVLSKYGPLDRLLQTGNVLTEAYAHGDFSPEMEASLEEHVDAVARFLRNTLSEMNS